MGFAYEDHRHYFIRCDNCGRRARFALHRIVCIAQAKKQGFQRFVVEDLNDKVVWVCPGCAKNETFVATLKANAPQAQAPAVKK